MKPSAPVTRTRKAAPSRGIYVPQRGLARKLGAPGLEARHEHVALEVCEIVRTAAPPHLGAPRRVERAQLKHARGQRGRVLRRHAYASSGFGNDGCALPV